MTTPSGFKVLIDPSFYEDFDGTPEELDAYIKGITAKALEQVAEMIRNGQTKGDMIELRDNEDELPRSLH